MFSVQKVSGLVIAENVFNILFNNCIPDDYSCSGYIDTFKNCRESGLVLCVDIKKGNKSDSTKVWVYENRNSDAIMVVIGKSSGLNNLFSEVAYKNAKYFNYNDFYAAAEYINEQLGKMVD